MAEHRLRELLDRAVADVAPRAADPVADVLRRDRRRHQRFAVASAAVVLLLAAGGVAAVARWTGAEDRNDVVASASPSEPTVPVQQGPARPRVVGKQVIAGGLVVPVPAGWHVIDDGKTIYCDVRPRTIAVGFDPVPGGTGRYCDLKPFIVVTGARLSSGLLTPRPATDLRQITLPGGQPGWLTTRTGEAPLGQRPYNVDSMYLPWSGASLQISLDQADFAEIFPTVRTRPVTPSALALPDKVVGARMTGPSRPDQPINATPRATDPGVLAQVLDRLGDLTDVVANDRACATVDMPTATLSLNTAAGPAAIVITLSDHCAQATSSLGGRVTVPPGFGNELWRLLGGQGALEAVR